MERNDRIVTLPFALTFAAAFGVFLAIGMLLPVLPVYARGPLETSDQPSGKLLHPAALGRGLVLVSAVLGFAGFTAFIALYARELGLDGAAPVFFLFAAVVISIRILGRKIPDQLGPKRAGASRSSYSPQDSW